MGDEAEKVIPMQHIIITGIDNLTGKNALSLNKNFALKDMWYNFNRKNQVIFYVSINNLTTVMQLIGWLSSIHIITVDFYNQDGFTMSIEISSQTKL